MTDLANTATETATKLGVTEIAETETIGTETSASVTEREIGIVRDMGVAGTTSNVLLLAMTIVGESLAEETMILVTVAAEGEMTRTGRVAESTAKGWEHRSAGHLRHPMRLRFHRGRERPAVGMFTLQATSSILLCRLSKQVCTMANLPLVEANAGLGLFNLPGANRTQIPPILAVPGLPPPMPVQSFGMGMGVNPNLSRQSRRLYIGSITPEINEQNLADFFNDKMKEMSIGTGAPGNPVLAVQCNYEKNYAFVEVSFFPRACSFALLT